MTGRPRESKRVGRIAKGQRLDSLTVRMPRATRNRIADLAELMGVSDSAVIVEIIEKRLAAMTPESWQVLHQMREARSRLASAAGEAVPFAAADRVVLSSSDSGHLAQPRGSSLARSRRGDRA